MIKTFEWVGGGRVSTIKHPDWGFKSSEDLDRCQFGLALTEYKLNHQSPMSLDWHERTSENFCVYIGKISAVNDKGPGDVFCVINDWGVTYLGA